MLLKSGSLCAWLQGTRIDTSLNPGPLSRLRRKLMFRSSALHLHHLIRGHHSVVQVVHDPLVGKNRVINRLQVVTVYSPNGNPPVHERDDGSKARASPALGVLPLPHTCARSGDSASGPRTVTPSTGMCTRSCVKTQLSDLCKKSHGQTHKRSQRWYRKHFAGPDFHDRCAVLPILRRNRQRGVGRLGWIAKLVSV